MSKRILMSLGAVAFVVGIILTAVGVFNVLDSPDESAASVNQPPTATATPLTTPTPAATLSPTLTGTPSPTPEPTPPLGETPYRMVIESLGVDATVETYGLDANAIPEIPNDSNSSDPAGIVVWYDFSAQPGMGTNAVFAGHYTWNGLAVFYNLGELQVGDTIRLVAEDGTELVYAVSTNFLVDPEDPSSLEVMRPTPTDTITLITCGGVWTQDPSDGVSGGSYNNRQVVQAELMSITAPAGPDGGY